MSTETAMNALTAHGRWLPMNRVLGKGAHKRKLPDAALLAEMLMSASVRHCGPCIEAR